MVFSKKGWLNTDPSLQKFKVLLQRNKLMPTTVQGYLDSIKLFTDFSGFKSASESLHYFKELSGGDKVQVIDDFFQHLLDNGVNSTTVVKTYRHLKKWLQLNDVQVDWRKIQDELLPGEEMVVSDRKPSKQELRQVMNVGKLRDGVMVLMLISSGLRVGTLASLTLGELELDKDPCAIVVTRKPGRKVSRKLGKYVTFITPEAKKMLLEYLEWRRGEGEQLSDASPVLTSSAKSELGKPLSSAYLSHHWRRLLQRAHLAEKTEGPWYTIHLHTLRKFFETQCVNAGVLTAYREHWMGHTGKHLESSYFRGGRERHVQEYMKAVPFLSLGTPKPEDYQELREKVKFLEANGKRKDKRIEGLQVKAGETEGLKQELADLRKQVAGIAARFREMEKET